MTGIGAGISGFSLGILLGDGAAKLGAMAGLDGSSLKTLISNFMGAFDGIGLVALGGLILAGAAIGASGVGVPAVIVGMTAIGAGIAGFMGALMVGDFFASLGGDNPGGSIATLLTNIGKAIGGFLGGFAGETMKQMEAIDGDKLAQIGKGIFDLGTGMIAFAGGKLADTGANIIGGIASFFGANDDGPLAKFAEISKDTSIDANRLTALGGGIKDLAEGLTAFANVSTTGLIGNQLALAEFSLPDMPDMNIEGKMAKMKNFIAGKTEEVEGKGSDLLAKSEVTKGAPKSVVYQDNRVSNNDNRNSTISQTSVAAKIDAVGTGEQFG
jgi:hypothetical protein